MHVTNKNNSRTCVAARQGIFGACSFAGVKKTTRVEDRETPRAHPVGSSAVLLTKSPAIGGANTSAEQTV